MKNPHIGSSLRSLLDEVDRPCCLACLTPATHVRRDTSGTKHHACPDHAKELELYVISVNGWSGNDAG